MLKQEHYNAFLFLRANPIVRKFENKLKSGQVYFDAVGFPVSVYEDFKRELIEELNSKGKAVSITFDHLNEPKLTSLFKT